MGMLGLYSEAGCWCGLGSVYFRTPAKRNRKNMRGHSQFFGNRRVGVAK